MQEGCHDIKNDQCYDSIRIRVCKCKKIVMTSKDDQGYDASGIRVCKCKKVVMTQKITDVMLLVRLEFVRARRLS